MNFQPKTGTEIAKEEEERRKKLLLPKGTYDFEVVAAEDKRSKAGNDMIQVTLRVWAPDGSEHFVTDFLMEAMLPKLYSFAHGTGLGAIYQQGNLSAEHCDGVTGKVKLKIGKPQENYGAKNEVQDYVIPETAQADDPGDEIPGVVNPKSHAADNEDMPDFLKK